MRSGLRPTPPVPRQTVRHSLGEGRSARTVGPDMLPPSARALVFRQVEEVVVRSSVQELPQRADAVAKLTGFTSVKD